MTLTEYLARRGVKAKALTRGEAALLGIAYPLQRGWARKHGAMMIAEGMVAQLMAFAGAARQAAKNRFRGERFTSAAPTQTAQQLSLVISPAPIRVSPVPGFALRRARRFCKLAR